jgi:hypothetical protein
LPVREISVHSQTLNQDCHEDKFMSAGLTDVNIITKTSWCAVFWACVIAVMGQLVPILLLLNYPSLVVYGQFVPILTTIVGIFQGLRIQTIDLSKAVRGSASITSTARLVAHEPTCAHYERVSQAIGKAHYEVPIADANQCPCSCHS